MMKAAKLGWAGEGLEQEEAQGGQKEGRSRAGSEQEKGRSR